MRKFPDIVDVVSLLMIVAPVFFYQQLGHEILWISIVGYLMGLVKRMRENSARAWDFFMEALGIFGLLLVVAVPFISGISSFWIKCSVIVGAVISSFVGYSAWAARLTGEDPSYGLFCELKKIISTFFFKVKR